MARHVISRDAVPIWCGDLRRRSTRALSIRLFRPSSRAWCSTRFGVSARTELMTINSRQDQVYGFIHDLKRHFRFSDPRGSVQRAFDEAYGP